ncbi:MAG: nitroreductase family deazaflavin-dependent oxidoreductase [Chloroflexota bacterium]
MPPLLELDPKSGWLRYAFRFPILLFRLRLGWLLGGRFLMLTHVGRISGVPRYVVLEIVEHDKEANTYYVVSGWGKKSDWFQNIMKTPQVIVQVGNRRFPAQAEILTVQEGEKRLFRYAQKYPFPFRQLTRWYLGEALAPTHQNTQRMAQITPLVRLNPD